MNVSVIIITHNNYSIIKDCLDSITSQLSSEDQLIVLDNNSTDGTYNLLQKNPYIDLLIKENINIGISKGRNKAASFAKNEYLFFVDSDMILHKGTIQSLKKYNSDIIVGIYHNLGQGLVWYREIKSKYLSKKNFVHCNYVTIENFYTMSGGFSAIKTNVFNELNGFDSFFDGATMEDIDFEIRALNKNKTIIITNRILGTHYKDELNKKKFFLWCINCGKGNARLFFKAKKNNITLPKTKYYPRCPIFCLLNFMCFIFFAFLINIYPYLSITGIFLSFYAYYIYFSDLFKSDKRKKIKTSMLLYIDDIITSISFFIETIRLKTKERDTISND